MFCPNCGKQIKDTDNFCRYCGADVRNEGFEESEKIKYTVSEKIYKMPAQSDEELVLYDVKKHWMSLFWPVFLTPVFLIYFWVIFLNTHSFFSWVVVFGILAGIIYPILRYNSDKIIITNKFVHIKLGVLNPESIDIPLDEANMLDVTRTALGKLLGYGTLTFTSNSERYDYNYIVSPEDMLYLIEDTTEFVKDMLQEEQESVVER